MRARGGGSASGAASAVGEPFPPRSSFGLGTIPNTPRLMQPPPKTMSPTESLSVRTTVSSENLGGLQYTFLCPKCKRQVPSHLGEARGSQTWCSRDVRAYKNLATRWQTNRDLKTWFDGLDDTERTQWFRKAQEALPGSKRKYDECTWTVGHSQAAFDTQGEADDWLPWSEWKVWRRDQEPPGRVISDEIAWNEFCEAVRNPRLNCIWARGQWNVPVFRGIKRLNGEAVRTQHTLQNTLNVRSEEDLVGLMGRGTEICQSFQDGCKPAGDTPAVCAWEVPEASIQDQAEQPVMANPVLGIMQREVNFCLRN